HTHQVAKTGAVTLIQRFGSALNLNVHFHMLFLDGVYVGSDAQWNENSR
ncbi:transposase, partial [Klebsiella pneumoniae]|nr:transposase [Salmonella enterica]